MSSVTPAPRYRQIADDLRRRLADGEFGPIGSRIPPIIDLQKEYDCENNLNMIRHAQSVLIDEGLIEPRQGQGTFIIGLPPRQDSDAALAEAAEELKVALGNAQTALAKFLARLAPTGSGLILAATITLTATWLLSPTPAATIQ
jgi:DNA-binding GntR family transcriptional regulator